MIKTEEVLKSIIKEYFELESEYYKQYSRGLDLSNEDSNRLMYLTDELQEYADN